MKRNNLRIIVFDVFLFLVLFLFRSFLSTHRYLYILVLGVFFLIFFFAFGYERDRHRHVLDSILDEIIYLFIFLMLYYLFGLVVGFVKTPILSFSYFFTQFFPFIVYLILREIFRYMVVCKSQDEMHMLVIEVILFAMIDIFSPFYAAKITSSYLFLVYFSTILVPAFVNGTVFTYLDCDVGFKPVLFYILFLEIFKVLIPILPNPSTYVYSVIFILVPFFLGYRQYQLFHEKTDKEIRKGSKRNQLSIKRIGLFACVVFFVVYYVSGYFRYWAVVIATGSMVDTIQIGDVVLIDQKNHQYDIGTIIAYHYHDTLVVHRIVDKTLVGDQYYYTTKGDFNDNVDAWLVEPNMVVGTVGVKIPYIGIPTVWFHRLSH